MKQPKELSLSFALLSFLIATVVIGGTVNERTQSKPGGALKNDSRETLQAKQDLTDLLAAASEGDRAEVQVLIGKGVDPKKQDDEGRSALLLAASNGHTGLVQDLLDRGAEVDVKTKNALTSYGALTPLSPPPCTMATLRL